MKHGEKVNVRTRRYFRDQRTRFAGCYARTQLKKKYKHLRETTQGKVRLYSLGEGLATLLATLGERLATLAEGLATMEAEVTLVESGTMVVLVALVVGRTMEVALVVSGRRMLRLKGLLRSEESLKPVSTISVSPWGNTAFTPAAVKTRKDFRRTTQGRVKHVHLYSLGVEVEATEVGPAGSAGALDWV